MSLCLRFGINGWRAPLSAPAVLALIDVLLAPEADESSPALRQSITMEPALAQWTAVQAAELDNISLSDAEQAAQWLCANVLRVLSGPSTIAAWDPSDAVSQRAVDLAVKHVRIAHWAAALAESNAAVASRAYFAALLHDPREWLSLCRDETGEAAGAELPGEFTELAIACGASPAKKDTNLGGHIAAAVAGVAGQMKPPSQCSLDLKKVAGAANAAGKRWVPPDEGHGGRLVRIVHILARLKQLETEFDVRLEAEKLEAMAEFAAGAGHEMNNPLAVISGRAQLLLRDEPSAGRRRDLAVIKGQATRVNEMIADVMLFGRPPRPRTVQLDVAEIVAGLIGRMRQRADREEKSIVFETPRQPVTVLADPVQLTAALTALCENALNAIGPGGRVLIGAGETARDDDSGDTTRQAVITVRDDGPGVAPELRARIFDPFFSGRQAGRGLGFGLSKCWRIITNHGGRIEVDSPPEGGAKFTVTLPCERETIDADSSAAGSGSDA